ncbi:(2Fe-2S) ferredoxin domain-containing protein [Candidatus Chrysopegis kryptomonas]|uniref:(2Fe-2S) ferredoxin n=1 Tax=Candidatus Chryseopegocella kryptomonas TaxID=1633643 RepID=A0A0N7MVV7_9BACT|nr:(2Fe-2S) ferredoxin domain-containing protein [Candidatus Chrysopegis kryptomonas]CUS96915.1 (2Fe-2S) ferredoxin [Candidatus Chrysopegis kryptomonas]
MRYKKHIFVCTNVRPPEHPKGSCGGKGSENFRDKFKKKIAELGLNKFVRVNSAGCLDACEYGISVVIYPEGIWYGGVSESDIDKIINEHLLNGKVVEELLIKDEKFKPELMLNSKIEPLQNERKQFQE